MSDLIDRQAAIVRACKVIKDDGTAYDVKEAIKAIPSAQPDLDEWCVDCKEYDHEKHFCPRFNRVIKRTLEGVKGGNDGTED